LRPIRIAIPVELAWCFASQADHAAGVANACSRSAGAGFAGAGFAAALGFDLGFAVRAGLATARP
jgi:hypothetical protein